MRNEYVKGLIKFKCNLMKTVTKHKITINSYVGERREKQRFFSMLKKCLSGFGSMRKTDYLELQEIRTKKLKMKLSLNERKRLSDKIVIYY